MGYVMKIETKIRKDLTGEKFGNLTAICRSETSRIKWVCTCDCGGQTESTVYSLLAGLSKSCGCSHKTEEFRRNSGARNIKHGLFGTVEYAAWNGMIGRCENSMSPDWDNYGGRGITVDPIWRHSPETFLRDMGPRPGKGYSVERVDVNGPYSPDNCIWDTQENQANNRRTNVNLTFEGRTQTVARWARELGIASPTLRDRLKTRSADGAIDFKKIKQGNPVTYKGETLSISEWAKRLGFSRRGLAKRLAKSTVEIAFNTPKRIWPYV